jgi:PEP-CTERM motif-containing protein
MWVEPRNASTGFGPQVHSLNLPMKVSSLFLLSVGLVLASRAQAQLDVPLTNVALAYPGLPPLTIQLGGTNRYILPTPFVLSGGSLNQSALWICMDPLQTIFYNGSGQPAGSALNYASNNPGLYDKWTLLAPGLNSDRLQDLADLFTKYAPTQIDSLIGGALQLAVPEITNEFDGNAFSLANGQFQAFGGSNASANAVIDLANTMLASLGDPNVKNHGNVASLRFLIDGWYTNGNGTVPVQDLVGFVPVPEPSTYAFAAVGLLIPLVGFRLRRRNTQAAASTSA